MASDTVLVTGAGGFIGAAVARRFRDAGSTVVTVDDFSTGSESVVPRGVEVVEGRCQDPDVLGQLHGRRFACIAHIAGQSSGEISFDDPVADLQSNAVSTLRLLELAVDSDCPSFVYASSMSVYGDVGDEPASEDKVAVPQSFYGVGKLATEGYLRLFGALHGMSTTALRLFSVYGPGQNMGNLRQGIVSIFLAQALETRHIHVKGAADRYRDLVYIDDVVEAFALAARPAGAGYRLFNVGTGIATTVGEMVEAIRSQLPYDVTVEYEGSTEGDVHGITADITRATSGLDWRARTSLSEGIAEMVASAVSATATSES